MVALYAAIVLLFSLPSMQKALADGAAHVLSKQLHSKVEIGSINLGLLNRLVVSDVEIYEPSGVRMASIARVSASINWASLFSGQIEIGTAQLFGTKVVLYKSTPESPLNAQFLIDAFKSDKQDEPSDIHLSIGSFIMRHADITYDVKSEKRRVGSLDVNHIQLKNCGMDVVLRCFTNDSLNVAVRRFQAKELHSGLSVRDTQLKLVANRQSATLTDFYLSCLHSHIATDSLYVEYGHFESDSTFLFTSSPIRGSVTLSDFSLFQEELSSFDNPLDINILAEGDEQEVRLKECSITSEDESLQLNASAQIHHPLVQSTRSVHSTINTLRIGNEEIQRIVAIGQPKDSLTQALNELKEVVYSGEIDYAAQGDWASKGSLSTGLGEVTYDVTYGSDGFLSGTLNGDSIQLGQLQGDERWGTASFSVELTMNLVDKSPFPAGKIVGDIYNIYYNGYNYRNIAVNAHSTSAQIEGTASIDDENVKAHADFSYTESPSKNLLLNLLLERFVPHHLKLTNQYADENLTLAISANLHGNDWEHLEGDASIRDLCLTTPNDSYSMERLDFHAENQGEGKSLYTLGSEVLSADIQGSVGLSELVKSFTNQIAHHLPILVQPTETTTADFTYHVTLADAPIFHHFTDVDFSLDKPVRIWGDVHAGQREMAFQLSAPCVTYSGKQYDDIALTCNATADNMNVHALASTFQESDDDDVPASTTKLDVTADVHDNTISSDLYLNMDGRNHIILQLLPNIQFRDSLGNMKTDIVLRKSNAVINDTTWTISPSCISFFKKNIECHNVKFANDNTNSFLSIDGRATSSPNDSLVVTLNNLEIKYLISLVDFDAVRFAGKASGHVIVNNVLGGGVPELRANLFVENLSVQEGSIGDANITAHWDKEVEGVAVEGRIVDLYEVPDGLTGRHKKITGITTVDGWISPAKNDMCINVDTHNTNAAFMHGFLGGVFKEVSGYVTGPISIIGPLNNVNIIGDAVPNMNLRLRATNVPYHIEGDTLHMRPYLFDFKDISIYDRFGHRSTINGQVTHRNMKNFVYRFKADLHELLAYDETEFNSDKFLATVFADGDLTIDGSDGHPLYVNASVTPTRGSVFAYDAATPDAITGSSFIEFRDRDSLLTIHPRRVSLPPEDEWETKPVQKDSLAIVKAAKKNYDSDIFINFDINLTPACEVKLRMDNIEDGGYMSTFGHAQLTAKWYNKGSFQLFGNYNIASGSYRLYLQDIIFRDLALQSGSMVEFNGNPFDANIHLICHHTIPSVPLSDLTNTTAFSQNNKVRVICILDITGKLGNMDFKFDMDIPNVNEEVRQLVRSMINSEEEMNTQMIYLLGLGRFYPNEYARANGGDNSSQAVNSLLSSTLSGQINQMLSNVIGNNGNWNFGSSLTTGEKGWDDLDVEGILEGRLFNERLLINGNFGYRDNALTNQANFIGDFEVKWRMNAKGSLYLKAYNQTNDRYFTKATLNTQGLGLSWRHDFETIRKRLRRKGKSEK